MATIGISDATLDRIRAREAEILGKPARVTPLDRQSVATEVQDATRRLRGALFANKPDLPLEVIPGIMFVLNRHQKLWDTVMALSMQLFQHGVLPARDRQLAVLRTGWLLGAPYEFGEHVGRSKAAGVSDEELTALVETGSAWPGWSAHDSAILKAAEELRADAMIGDATWATLAETYDEPQLFELCVLIGQFTNVAYFQNALRIRLEKGNPGLVAR